MPKQVFDSKSYNPKAVEAFKAVILWATVGAGLIGATAYCLLLLKSN